MIILALVGTFVIPASWNIHYPVWQLCIAVWVVFMLSYAAGNIPKDAEGYNVLVKYIAGAAVRMVGIIAVIFYPVMTAEKGSFNGMLLVLCVMELYAVGIGLYLMKIKKMSA